MDMKLHLFKELSTLNLKAVFTICTFIRKQFLRKQNNNGIFNFSKEIFPNHIPRKHSLDCCILILDGMVGHRHWKHSWNSTRGERKQNKSVQTEEKVKDGSNLRHLKI